MLSGVRVRVPATSANLGPGLDALGLALSLHNDVTVRTAPSGAEVSIEGEGSGRFATGEGNLVVRSIRAALEELGGPSLGLVLHCANRIPSARGLGSSAASIVAGVVAGAALAGWKLDTGALAGGPLDSGALGRGALVGGPLDNGVFEERQRLDTDWAVELCARLEGHPDNVAACLLGGVTVAWCEADGRARAVRADPANDLVAVALVPAGRVATADARKLLPDRVSLVDAAHSAGRAALMTWALTSRTDVLLSATEDRLHQIYRRAAMPDSLALMGRLRAHGLAATISGAGPTVLVLGSAKAGSEDLMAAAVAVGLEGFDPILLRPDPAGVRVSGVE